MKMLQEFKAFIERGRVMDLAIAVVMGGAFNAIVASVVDDLIVPLLSLITMGTEFSELKVTLGAGEHAAELTYGNFLGAIIHFLMVSIVIFLAIKAYNKFADKKIGEAPPTQTCPYCASVIAESAVRCPQCTSLLDETAVPAAAQS